MDGLLEAGIPLRTNLQLLKEDPPHIVVGTPGRIKDLLSRPDGLKLDKVKFFILDECDKMLEAAGRHDGRRVLPWCARRRCPHRVCPVFPPADMRADVQKIFVQTPVEKQVMMFSATLSPEVRTVCRKFMSDVSGEREHVVRLVWSLLLGMPARHAKSLFLVLPVVACSRWRSTSTSRRS